MFQGCQVGVSALWHLVYQWHPLEQKRGIGNSGAFGVSWSQEMPTVSGLSSQRARLSFFWKGGRLFVTCLAVTVLAMLL